MITKDKTSSIISISLLAVILVLAYNLINKFDLLDLSYLLFLLGCLIRFIYIKIH